MTRQEKSERVNQLSAKMQEAKRAAVKKALASGNWTGRIDELIDFGFDMGAWSAEMKELARTPVSDDTPQVTYKVAPPKEEPIRYNAPEPIKASERTVSSAPEEEKKTAYRLTKTESRVHKESTIMVNNILTAVATTQADKYLGKLGDKIGTQLSIEKINKTLEEAARIKQKVEDAQQLKGIKVHDLAEAFIGQRMEEAMLKEVDKLGDRSNMSEEKKNRIRSIVRGYGYALLTQGPVMEDAVKQTEALLLDSLQEQSDRLMSKGEKTLDKAVTRADAKITEWSDKATGYLDKAQRELDRLTNIEHITKVCDGMLHGLTDKLTGNKDLNSFCSKIDGFVNQGGAFAALNGGLPFSSAGMVKNLVANIETRVGAAMETKMKPFIEKHIQTVAKITTAISKIKDQVKAATAALKAQLKKFQDMAMNYAKEFTQKLVSDISSKVNISFGGGGLGF